MSHVIFNPDVLNGWEQVDPVRWRTVVLEILEIFFETGPEQYRDLQAAVARRDFDQARKLAHSLKSICGSVGAEACHTLLDQIENGPGDIEGLAKKMHSLFGASVENLIRYRLQIQNSLKT